MNKTPKKNNSSTPFTINKSIPTIKSILKNIYGLLNKKYCKNPVQYNQDIIEKIMFDEKYHIVAIFKERLIMDDPGEFLKRFYFKDELEIKLIQLYKYYYLYSKIFPNYTVFTEGKYLYLNIKKKQKMIDFLEQMELEKRIKEKRDSFSSLFESEENVFNTDVMNSLLNGTNDDLLNLLFDYNQNDIQEEEDTFENDVNNIVEEIGKYEFNQKKNVIPNKIFKIKLDKIKIEKTNNPTNHNIIINYNNKVENHINNNQININYHRIETYKDNITHKNMSIPINLNHTKGKRMVNSHSSSTINNNITCQNDFKDIVSKYFNNPSYQKIILLNMNQNTNKNHTIEKIEKNLLKAKQRSFLFQKSSQNISTSNQTQKDISLSKKNLNIKYTKISSNPTSSIKQNQTNIRKNINNSNSCKVKNNNIVKYIEKRNKGITPLTSRIPKSNKTLEKMGNNKSAKNIKLNTFYNSENMSRNKYSNINQMNNNLKPTLLASESNHINRINQSQTNKSEYVNMINNTKFQIPDAIPKIKTKEINFKLNQNSVLRNINAIKEKILNNGFNFNNTRNDHIKYTHKSNSQKNSIRSKKKNHLNDSNLKLGISGILKEKKKESKVYNIKHLSKVINDFNNNHNYNNYFS